MSQKISIIIPTYNRAHIIGETLDSIVSQTYNNWECIIVDDGSTDDTQGLIETYINKDSRFKFLKRPDGRVKGPNSCRNIGFKESTGDFIQWFDSDDIYKPNALKSYIEAFEDNLDAVVAPLERVVLETGSVLGNNSITSTQPILDYIEGNITYYVSGPLWRKSFLLNQKDLFDEDIRNMDDWDFNLRMLYATPNIKFLNTPFILYRVHPDSLNKELNKANIIEIRSDLFAREKQLKILQKMNLDIEFEALQDFILKRKRRFLRRSVKENAPFKTQFFKETIVAHVKRFQIFKAFKISIGFISYSIFKKGFKWMK